MKKLIFILAVLGWALGCSPRKQAADAASHIAALKPEKDENGEWDLDVLDSQYDYFLNAIAKPMSYYTESYLKSKNRQLVNEWNALYYTGRYRDVIESSIDYDYKENYGLKFEYRLYQVFAYVQWKYGLKLNSLSGSEIR